ncbi:MAG: tetratricopeptide repeat protein [Planctomycetota bacterium]
MGPVAILVAAAAGAIPPVHFEARPYDTIIIKATGNAIKGTLLTAPDAETVRIRTIRGHSVGFERDLIREIRPRLTLEEAHDEVASRIAPSDHTKWHGLALACLSKRPPLKEKAVADLGQALKASANHLPSLVLLARTYLDLERVDDARRTYERAAKAFPGNDEVRMLKGMLVAASGGDPRAELRKAVEIRPSVEGFLELAQAELRYADYDAAEAAVAAAARETPRSRDVLAARGDVLLAKGRFADAEAAYTEALDASGRSFGPRIDAVRLGLAAVQYVQARFDEADRTLLRADVSNPRVPYLQGLIRLARGGDETASARERFMRSASGGCARAYLGLATHLYHDLGGDVAAARGQARKAIEAGPEDAHAAEIAAWCEYRTGEFAKAAETYAKLTKLAPRYAAGHAAAAAVALEAKQHPEAVRRYRAGLEACPGSGRLLAGLGLAQIAAGDLGAAAKSLEQSLAAGFTGPDVYLGLGYLANERKDFAGAAARFTSALAAASAGGSRKAERYAADALAQVTDARGMKLAAFAFDGGPGLPAPLRPDARFGVSAKVTGGELVLAGTQEKIDDGRTRAHANADAGVFRSVAADVRAAAASAATAGVFVESRNGSVELARTPMNAAAFRVKDGRDSPWGAWQTLVEWPADGCMRLQIVMLETQVNLARLEVRASRPLPGAGEPPVKRVVELKNALWRERALSVGAFAGAPMGAEIDARFDNVSLVDRKVSAAP